MQMTLILKMRIVEIRNTGDSNLKKRITRNRKWRSTCFKTGTIAIE